VDWHDTIEQSEFRAEVQHFIKERFPEAYTPDSQSEHSLEPEDVPGYNWMADRCSADAQRRQAANAWAAALAENGWIAPHWPTEFGGAGLSAGEAFILHEEMMRAQVPTVNGIATFLLGPTLMEFGSPEQQQRHLPKISSGQETWAQGFSEPNAGSDLAAVQTKAIRDGDHYIVNGQKVWTSLAQYADWLMILVRTDLNASKKHRGITFLMIDAHSPGVTIRPIQDIRGDYPFTEIFLEDVQVPLANRLGEENKGFYVAMATLAFERSGIGATIKYEQLLKQLIDSVRSDEGPAVLRKDWKQSVRHEIAQRLIETRVLYNLALLTVSKQMAGEIPDFEASLNQLFSAELHQRLTRTGAKAFGIYGSLWERDQAPLNGDFAHLTLDTVCQTFLGGTTEIQRNVIATRGLGLPKA